MATEMLDETKPPATPPANVPDRTPSRWERAYTRSRPLGFMRQLVNGLIDDNITDLGAMMAYYAVLALFPMMVFIVTIALIAIDAETIHAGVLMVTRALPESGRKMISEQVTNLINSADGGLAIGSALVAMWGASRGIAALGGALNTIAGKVETRPYLRRQVIAVAVTLGVALMAVVALGLLVVGPVVGHYVADRFGLGDTFDITWEIGRWVGAGFLVMVVSGLVYHFAPDTEVPFRVFTTGSFVGVTLWLAISFVFNLYLSNFNSYDATYGALGGAIIFLTWLWLSNMALLVGAEVNDVLARTRREKAEAFLAQSAVSDLPRA